MILIMLTVVVAAAWATAFFKLGHYIGKADRKAISVGEIEEFIKNKWPNRWKAYVQGINEGYEQGLRDGQDLDQ